MNASPGPPAADAIPATVMVLTRNAAATLDATLASVREFAEVIVCDGASDDATRQVARAHGAVVIDQDPSLLDGDGRLRDYAGARHQVVRAARQPWILHLDADEVATPELAAGIRRVIAADDGSVAGYLCRGRHVVGSRVVRTAANYPMRFLRLFRTAAVTDYAGPINEHPVFAPDARVEVLDEHFLIPMPPLRTVVRKWMHYQRIIAADARGRGLVAWRRDELPVRLREIRWLAWRTWKAHRVEPGPRLPLRYDVARIGFHVAGALASGLGSVRSAPEGP